MRKNRSGCIRWVAMLVLGGGLIFVFRFELMFGWNMLRSLISGQPAVSVPELANAMKITLFIVENALAAGFFIILVLYWIASSGFPVNNNHQVSLLMRRMLGLIIGRGAPVLIVREGVLVGEVSRSSADVMLVDLNSAAVIERQGVSRPPDSKSNVNGGLPVVVRPSMARIGLPGLVILHAGERLRDVVSLRKQFRIQLDVLGQTSEGIELRTNTFVIFTLGQPPDVTQVAYMGEENPQNLCVLQIDGETRKIKAIRDELDPQDKEEIHSHAQSFLYYIEPNSQLITGVKLGEAPPYQINEQRIFSAVYSQARNVADSQTSNSWTDLPAMIAAETFRNVIARYTLNDLYRPDDPNIFPLQEVVKPEFSRRIRSLGLMSFQFLQRNDGSPPQVNQRIDHRNFRIAPVRELQGSKVLRERGIKVIHAGFSELNPTDPQVNLQRMENWRAHWQKEADMIRADMDLEVMRIRNNAKAEKQREMIEQLSSLMRSSAYSEEALSLRIFQILEEMAADPATRQFLPKDAFGLLESLQLDLAVGNKPGQNLLDSGASEEQEK